MSRIARLAGWGSAAVAAVVVTAGPAAASLPQPEADVSTTGTAPVGQRVPVRKAPDRGAETGQLLAAAAVGAVLGAVVRRRRDRGHTDGQGPGLVLVDLTDAVAARRRS